MQPDVDALNNLAFASKLSAYVQSRPGLSSLAPFHVDRFRDLAGKAGVRVAVGFGDAAPPTCPACAAVCGAGWNAASTLERPRLGKRKRRNDNARKAAVSTGRLRTTCECGYAMAGGSPDQGALKRFKRRKKSQFHDGSLCYSAGPSPPVTEPLSLEHPKKDLLPEAEFAVPSILQPSSSPPLSTSFKAVASFKAVVEKPAPRVQTAIARPTLSSIDPSSLPAKKKRGKKESLQAMLAARKQADEQHKHSSSGSFGLSSFLQSL